VPHIKSILETGVIDHHSFMVNVCRSILHERIKQADQETNRADLLHAMIQNRPESIRHETKCPMMSGKGNGESNACPAMIKKDFDEKTIISNMILFYEAGYETSSTGLTFMANLLTSFPANQRRMRVEVLRVLTRHGLLQSTTKTDELTDEQLLNTHFTYDRRQLQQSMTLSVLRQMHWMDCFIRETMRVYPPVWNFVSRTASRSDTLVYVPELKRSITLQEDVRILFPIIHIHHDPNYWLQPFRFRPQRFSAVISDQDLTAAELAEQQQVELDPYHLKNSASLRFSDNQPRDATPEPLTARDGAQQPSDHDEDDADDEKVLDEQEAESGEMFADDLAPNSGSKISLKRIDNAHYMPFGIGPRNCIGMRFALLEIKLTLCMMLLEYDMKPSAEETKETRGQLDIEFKSVTIATRSDVNVNFQPNPLITIIN
jgi:cytochrome P450